MKYRSPTGEPVRVSSTSGRVMIIGPDLAEVPPDLEAKARYKGCVSEEVLNGLSQNAGTNTSLLSVEDAIRNMISMPEEGDFFTAQGLPNLRALTKLCQRNITKEEMMTAWEVVSAEKDAEEEAKG